jgi:hypothetical protein
MADVFKDFLVVIESADGTRRGSLTPEEFRAASGCSRTAFLSDCIDRYNAGQARQGYEDRARLEMRTTPKGKRR